MSQAADDREGMERGEVVVVVVTEGGGGSSVWAERVIVAGNTHMHRAVVSNCDTAWQRMEMWVSAGCCVLLILSLFVLRGNDSQR